MPTYKYKREDGTEFEKVQSIKSDPLSHCPETGQKVERLINWQGETIFKGKGFPDKERKKKATAEKAAKNPGYTTIDEYQKTIDKNTEKARKLKAGEKNVI